MRPVAQWPSNPLLPSILTLSSKPRVFPEQVESPMLDVVVVTFVCSVPALSSPAPLASAPKFAFVAQ